MNIYEELEQGSPEWFLARSGVITASMFGTVLAKGQGKTRSKYLYQLAGERLTGEVIETYTNAHMERGHVMEEEARILYQMANDVEVKQVGFIKSCDDIGYSPDSLVGDAGLTEIKSKLPHLQIEVLLKDRLPPEHKPQCQGGLWVSEREWIDFVSYWPGLPLFVKRIYRDEEYIKNLESEVYRFRDELNEITEKIRAM